jgi:hypothetical protein
LTKNYGLASYSTEQKIPQQILPHFCNFTQWLIRWPSLNKSIGSTIFIRQETACLTDEKRNPFTPNEQVLHNKNSMIGVYNIQFGKKNIQLWIPQYLDKMYQKDEWIFIQQNHFYVAIQFYQPIKFLQSELLNGVYYQIYNSHGSKNAALVLTDEESQYTNFQEFVENITQIKRLYLNISYQTNTKNTIATTIATGVNLMNETFVIEHDGNHYINNHLVNYTKWPSINVLQNQSDRLVFQKQNNSKLHLNIPNFKKCHYDFDRWYTNCL